MIRAIALVLVLLIAAAVSVVYAIGRGWLSEHPDPGVVTPVAIPAEILAERDAAQEGAASAVGVAQPKQIVFGDLHVHTTYSLDAFALSLPLSQGEGAHPPADACDFARYCSALDFWSINDHAAALTPLNWSETVESLRQCNAVAGNGRDPDSVAFLGWEWTQMGTSAKDHYGHKNVILAGLDDGEIPTRPIAARIAGVVGATQSPSPFALGLLPILGRDPAYLDMVTYFLERMDIPPCPDGVPVRDLPDDCRESVATPRELFAKLDEWGHEALVIPHGTTWGYYTPLGSSWNKQLNPTQHDPARQRLVEVYSGHGNSEEYRGWREVVFDANGERTCPPLAPNFVPSCWRAGEIIQRRCRDAGESPEECRQRAAEARQNYVRGDVQGFLAVPAATLEDWADAGQCTDCFQPAFNYRPLSSVQYMMALSNFDGPEPLRFRFGFMAASDNHSARPGTGYKEFARGSMTESGFGAFKHGIIPVAARSSPEPLPYSVPYEPSDSSGFSFFRLRETERSASFFVTGGLAAAHSEGRGRGAIWDALQRKEVYGTSGPRILLWFDLLNAPHDEETAAPGRLPMGSEVRMGSSPRFEVRAVGSFEQRPGCPDYAVNALAPERLPSLCRGECYHPSDQRRLITRIEVVRVRPQIERDEPIGLLIEDPWQVFPCEPDRAGCRVEFSDPDFENEGRDSLYYVRAIEEPSLAVNAANLGCERAETGRCLRVNACVDVPADDDCLAETEQRAWSSPIFVDFSVP